MQKFGYLFLLIVLAGCQAGAQPAPTSEPGGGAIALEDCQLTAPGDGFQIDAQCGTHTVYENRTSQSGRQISLNIAVIPAVSRSAASDPVFFFAGGPGQAATETFVFLASAFREINQTRDIVLVDQRGTGGSSPLRCKVDESQAEEADDITTYLEACLAALDADPAQYTTTIAMHDLDEIRELLGYDQINLYGLSYGTRAAMTYMRMYPQNVRTAILDGLAPPQLPLGLSMAADAQHAFDLIAARCEADLECGTQFPGIKTSLNEMLSSLEVVPVEVNVTHPITGEPTSVSVTREIVTTVIRFHSYNPESVALLPLMIHNSHTTGDYSYWAAQFLMTTSDLDASISNAMSYSVICPEDVAFFSESQIAPENEGTYLGVELAETFKVICAVWPGGDVPPDFKDPLRSDIPVLLLSGEYDPVTPPEYGELAAQTLPNSLHLIVPGMGHNVIMRGCVPLLAGAFLENGTTSGLDTTCVEQVVPFPFFVNFSGPTP